MIAPPSTLHTLAGLAMHAVDIRHSRFVAKAAAVTAPDHALRVLAELSSDDATHNCWAYRIGDAYRSSDDGEPAGTAGRPILAAIDGQACDRVLVVVTRWYGGIKLGAGGLLRAYGGVASECLRRAERVPLVEFASLALQAAFDDLGHVHAALAAFEAEKLAEIFDPEGVRIAVRVAADRVGALKTQLRDATRDRVRFDDNG